MKLNSDFVIVVVVIVTSLYHCQIHYHHYKEHKKIVHVTTNEF